jgi:hypothetical protein
MRLSRIAHNQRPKLICASSRMVDLRRTGFTGINWIGFLISGILLSILSDPCLMNEKR